MSARIFPRNIGINCDNAMRCFFDITPLETKVYRDLLTRGPGTALEVGERVERDRSTAYRSLMRLVDNELAVKKLMNREGGGIYHVYEAVNPEDVQDKLLEVINEWYEDMKSVVERASADLRG